MSSSRSYQRPPLLRVALSSKSKRSLSIWERRWRYIYYRFVRLRGTPEFIARGLAAGVFTGMFPIFGFQMLAGIALATLIRGNKVVAAAGTWISNPITSLPIFAWNFQLGRWLTGSEASFEPESMKSFDHLIEFGADVLTDLFIGSLLMGILAAIASYVLSVRLLRRLRQRRLQR